MGDISFIKSSRGGNLLVYQNFIFRIHKKKDDISYWKCSSKSTCKARIKLNKNNLESFSGYHTHEPPRKEIQRKEFSSKLKERAVTEMTVPVSRIYNEEISITAKTKEVATCLPNFQISEKIMYRARSAVRPPLPLSKNDINLTEPWKKTKNGEDFLLVDDGDGENRMLIFGTKENLRKLCSSSRVFLDGTFKIAPKLFNQLYSLHGMFMGKVFPLIFALLPNKSEDTYKRLIKNLINKASSFNLELKPNFMILDFELSAINALRGIFPGATIKGCFFHFTQCIWRKVQEMGLVSQYKNDEIVRKWVRRIAALPLVPENQVAEAFLWLQEEAPDVPQTQKMYDYLAETWLDECQSLFQMDIWNHFSNDGSRTNNHVEGFHSKLNRRAGQPHQNIYCLIELLKTLQNENEAGMLMLEVGSATATKQKAKYRKIHENLIVLKQRLITKNITLMRYIDCVSYFLHL